MSADKIIDGLKDAVAYVKGDETRAKASRPLPDDAVVINTPGYVNIVPEDTLPQPYRSARRLATQLARIRNAYQHPTHWQEAVASEMAEVRALLKEIEEAK